MSDSITTISTQESDFEQLEQIKEFIFKEFDNLYKNRTRHRSQQGIFHKSEILRTALEEFEEIIRKYEQLNETEIWNGLTDKWEIVKKKYKDCLQILENSKQIENLKKHSVKHTQKFHDLRNRRVSVSEDHFVANTEDFSNLNVSISETDLYFGAIRDPNLLSSTLNNADQSEIDTKSLIFQELKEFSDKFQPAYKSFLKKMAYEFPTEKAIKCIPEFRGTASELDGFLFQIDYFAKLIPAAVEDGQIHAAETELIHVILSKLKGPASLHFKRVNAETWAKVRDNLQREFGGKLKLEELFHKIETLEQGKTETFQSYKDRVLNIKEFVDEYEANRGGGDNSYAHRNLRIHFLGGLKNRNLKNLAKAHKEDSLEELIAYLQEECIDVEQIENIEHRLRDAHIAESQRLQNNKGNGNNRPKNFGNFGDNNKSFTQGIRNNVNRNQEYHNRRQNNYQRNNNSRFQDFNQVRDGNFRRNEQNYRNDRQYQNERNNYDSNSYRNSQNQNYGNQNNNSYRNYNEQHYNNNTYRNRNSQSYHNNQERNPSYKEFNRNEFNQQRGFEPTRRVNWEFRNDETNQNTKN